MKTRHILLLSALACAVTTSGCGLLKKRTPVSQTVNGTIATGDHVLEQDNSLYDEYTVDVESGWVIHATMTSDAFDTYLLLIGPDGNRAAYNDDDASLGGKGTNSQFTFTATQSGVYKIYADAFQAGETGPYALTYSAGPSVAIPTPPVIPNLPPAAPAGPGRAPAGPGGAPVPAPIAPEPIAPAPGPATR